jgi:hypothetical protein
MILKKLNISLINFCENVWGIEPNLYFCFLVTKATYEE